MPTNFPTFLPGQASRGYSPAYGGVPYVPSLGATQTGAIASNLGNLTDLSGLTRQLTTLGTGEATQALEAALPGYGRARGLNMGNIQRLLRGQVPADVLAQIEQAGAERGIAGGMPGGANANAAMLRALGLTSLQLQQQGQQGLTTAVQTTPVGPQFNPESFLVSPSGMQEAQSAANLYAAAPIPQIAAQEAMNQARAGAAAGRGRGGYIMMPGAGGGGFTAAPPSMGGYYDDTAYPSLATGVSYPEGGGPAAQNWQAWAASLPAGATTGTGTTAFGYDPTQYSAPAGPTAGQMGFDASGAGTTMADLGMDYLYGGG